MNRCVNLDWVEVFAKEPPGVILNAAYFMRQGYFVKAREYGTPQYKEMFVVFEHDFPFIEVRRNPYSLKNNGGIFDQNDCHLRLSNRACYSYSPIDDLRVFMLTHGYRYQSLTRIDICLDFNVFDRGDSPSNIVAAYMRGDLWKINQCNIAAHGKDKWFNRVWNSLKWGSDKSMISTKLYNKSLELKEVKDKFYIRDAWQAAGLDLEKDVWRVEFSVKSEMKHLTKVAVLSSVLKDKEQEDTIKHDLTCYDTREKLLYRFHNFANIYFHFKHVEYTADGKLQRKDRCRDKILFRISPEERVYKPCRLTEDEEPSRTDKIMLKYCARIIQDEKQPKNLREAAQVFLMYFHEHKRLVDREHSYNILLMFYEQMETAVQ